MEEIIQPSSSALDLRLAELWRYRELLWTMAMRSVLVRYKQTLVGVLWAILRPVITMLIFTVVFGHLAGMGKGDPFYHLKVLAAVLPWQLFAQSLTQSTQSIVGSAGMIQKIYFPRIILPASSCIVGLIDFCLAAAVLAILMAAQGVLPGWRVALLPGLVCLALVAALGTGLWLSALNVRFRDVHHIVPFIVQVGIYISPVGFSSSIVPDRWRMLYSLNPMVSVIDGFRWALFDAAGFHLDAFLMSSLVVLLLFAGGLAYFNRQSRTFADHI